MWRWIAKAGIIGDVGDGSKRSECGYRSFYLSRIVAGGGIQEKMRRLERGSSVGEGASLGGWEMTGPRREDGIAGSSSVNGSGLYKRMGAMGWK